MWPFKKILDYKKDGLYINFDLATGQFCYFKNGIPVDKKSLNRRTRKKLEKEISSIEKNPKYLEIYKEAYNASKRNDYLKGKGIHLKDNLSVLGATQNQMTKEVEEFLNRVVSEPGVIIGIHRSCATEEIVDCIFENGIELSEHESSGKIGYENNIQNNISFYYQNKEIINQALCADSYKYSTGSFIIRIPECEFESPKINKSLSNAKPHLDPKYIVCFLPIKDGVIKEIIMPSKKQMVVEPKKDIVIQEYEPKEDIGFDEEKRHLRR